MHFAEASSHYMAYPINERWDETLSPKLVSHDWPPRRL